MSVATLLDRLDRPKQVRLGSWVAGCPCCQSKQGRPVSVRELEDGRILLHAFCGCGTEDVLTALGLTFGDLFAERLTGSSPAGGFGRHHSKVAAREVLQTLSQEITTVALLAADFLDQRTISEGRWQLLAQAAARIQSARDYVLGR